LILAFDTSAAHCAALLLCGDTVLAARHENMAKGQVERLFPLLEELLAEAGKNWSGLSAIGVCTGPGNFTGVRIGVASARGLALSLNIPAVGISMLEALAFDTLGPGLSILDARRDRFFVQAFDDGIASGEPGICTADALPLNGQQINAVAPLPFADSPHIPARPVESIARLTAQRFATTTQRPAPLYLRAPNAALPTEQPPAILP
jgi:tRNA threonylcarbamoyl adenosine modification protein YeaZ